MSEERRIKQARRHEIGFFKHVEKWKRMLRNLSIGAIILNFIWNSIQGKFREWVLLKLGSNLGNWLIGNPFSIVTIFLVCVVLWLIYVAIREALTSEATGLVHPHSKREIYRPRLNPRFAAWFSVTALIFVAAVAYGSWHYYKMPIPPYVRESSSWFDIHFKGADLWVTINVQNFSDQVLDATGEIDATAFNQPIPRDTNDPSANDRNGSLKIMPWGKSYQHITFIFGPELVRAYEADAIVVTRKISYQVGQTKYIYHYTGRVMHDTKNCWACEGSLEFVSDGWDPDPFTQRAQK